MLGIKRMKEDIEKLKEKIDFLTDFVLEQQGEINKLKDKDKKPKYMG